MKRHTVKHFKTTNNGWKGLSDEKAKYYKLMNNLLRALETKGSN